MLITVKNRAGISHRSVTPVMEEVYNDAVKNSIIREVKFIADPSDIEVLMIHPIETDRIR